MVNGDGSTKTNGQIVWEAARTSLTVLMLLGVFVQIGRSLSQLEQVQKSIDGLTNAIDREATDITTVRLDESKLSERVDSLAQRMVRMENMYGNWASPRR